MTVLPKNKEILKLLESLKKMPEVLEEKRRRYYADKEFRQTVFGPAMMQSGLVERLRNRLEEYEKARLEEKNNSQSK